MLFAPQCGVHTFTSLREGVVEECASTWQQTPRFPMAPAVQGNGASLHISTLGKGFRRSISFQISS